MYGEMQESAYLNYYFHMHLSYLGPPSWNLNFHILSSSLTIRSCSVTQPCPTLCDPQEVSQYHSSVQFSHWVVSRSLWRHGLQHTRFPCPSPTPGGCSNSCSSSPWCYPTNLSSVVPSPPAFKLSQHQGLFQWVNSSHQVAKILEFQVQHQSFQWTPRTDLL